ncbi:hypothetical protein Tco_1071344 [Tanacetum coccineum]
MGEGANMAFAKAWYPLAEEASSIWLNDRMLRSSASESILRCLSRMLHESTDADVTINIGEGASKAHKAIQQHPYI